MEVKSNTRATRMVREDVGKTRKGTRQRGGWGIVTWVMEERVQLDRWWKVKGGYGGGCMFVHVEEVVDHQYLTTNMR